MALSLDVEVGDTVMVGNAVIKLIHKTGRKARLSIDADETVPVSLNPNQSLRHGQSGRGKNISA